MTMLPYSSWLACHRSRALSCIRNKNAHALSAIVTSMSRFLSRNQQQASYQRSLCLLPNAANARTNKRIIQQLPSNSSANAFKSSVQFEWEEKRSWEITTPEALNKRINRIRNLATEARLCIQDCAESVNTPHFEEEFHSATKAVELAEVAYSELIEELASCNQVELLNATRRNFAPEVESVREELRGALHRLRESERDESQ